MWIFRHCSGVNFVTCRNKIQDESILKSNEFTLNIVTPPLISLYLSCRNKRETKSYVEISESVGVDRPSEILFVTDIYQEAVAAKAAGN